MALDTTLAYAARALPDAKWLARGYGQQPLNASNDRPWRADRPVTEEHLRGAAMCPERAFKFDARIGNDQADWALCFAPVPRPAASSLTSLHRTPNRPDPAGADSPQKLTPRLSGVRRSGVKEEAKPGDRSGVAHPIAVAGATQLPQCAVLRSELTEIESALQRAPAPGTELPAREILDTSPP
jgi:hypothetical protein